MTLRNKVWAMGGGRAGVTDLESNLGPDRCDRKGVGVAMGGVQGQQHRTNGIAETGAPPLEIFHRHDNLDLNNKLEHSDRKGMSHVAWHVTQGDRGTKERGPGGGGRGSLPLCTQT